MDDIRAQGTEIGFDGIWFDGVRHIIVEVKTTDTYRINLDTIRAYGDRAAVGPGKVDPDFSILIVVGREDTGDLEAQVRGSRHAWSTRLISVESLVKLMFINEEVDDTSLLERIRRVLLPFEYTRVDNIVDLVFDTQQESDQKAQTIEETSDPQGDIARQRSTYQFTPAAELESKRMKIVEAFFRQKKLLPVRRSKTNFSDANSKLGATVAISKRYKRDYQPYWYALHPEWIEFLRTLKDAYYVLGCMDRDEAFALPLEVVEAHLDHWNRTEKSDRHYWHIALVMDGPSLALNLPKISKRLDIAPFAFKLT